jgi:Prokaryotic Cytochrome C oxidase subunit IV
MDAGRDDLAVSDIARTMWLLLCLLSVVSFAVVEGGLVTAIASVIVVAVAALKARIIMVHFMEIKSIPAKWQSMYAAWIVAASVIILCSNFIAMLKS